MQKYAFRAVVACLAVALFASASPAALSPEQYKCQNTAAKQSRKLFKKIFISRERIHREVDELVNKTLPKRVEEYLRGPAFEQEAESVLNATIDNVMARPLDELIGQFDAIRFEDLKSQISNRLIEILRSEALSTSLSIQVTDAIDRLRPQTLGAVMQQLDSNSAAQVSTSLNTASMPRALRTRRTSFSPVCQR